ncbi:MAG: GNAT family N-acetyltransferase [Anaeroplasmataceae bacterium]|nr:GNAT family N-acetyltransferase [Anaeroplasmataceae bacterium]
MEVYKNYADVTKDIIDIRRMVFIEEQGVPIELELEAEEKNYIHCCLYIEDKLIAYARVSKQTPITIGRVCVKKEFRHLGYGNKIMRYAENQISISNTDIFIHAQLQAKKFYESLGYIPFGNQFMEAKIEHIVMKKRKA